MPKKEPAVKGYLAGKLTGLSIPKVAG